MVVTNDEIDRQEGRSRGQPVYPPSPDDRIMQRFLCHPSNRSTCCAQRLVNPVLISMLWFTHMLAAQHPSEVPRRRFSSRPSGQEHGKLKNCDCRFLAVWRSGSPGRNITCRSAWHVTVSEPWWKREGLWKTLRFFPSQASPHPARLTQCRDGRRVVAWEVIRSRSRSLYAPGSLFNVFCISV
ncbi:hypothetical protein LY76DRAFT_182193 [Colletotrichum caudatum]|nr:hypothetical protein LY76DRAFT_182193 [Colletotrichum caudatum]